MKLEMTNLESLQACREATVIEEVVQIISHAPYDVFEQTISAHISQFIGYSPSLQFNTFGDVVLPLIELAEETNQTKIAYVFNWADVSPVFEMNSRQGEAVKEINEGVLLEKINEHISILKRVEENSNVNLVLFLPDINETYLAMGHVHEKANINIAYSHLLQGPAINDCKQCLYWLSHEHVPLQGMFHLYQAKIKPDLRLNFLLLASRSIYVHLFFLVTRLHLSL